MSVSLVNKSLDIVDPGGCKNKGCKRKSKEGSKNGNNINLLSNSSKLTVTEARKKIKSKDQILKENLKKLKLIKEASKIKLEKSVVNQIIQRAVTRRPVNKVGKLKKKKDKKTAFTEEDFKKFEEEYLYE